MAATKAYDRARRLLVAKYKDEFYRYYAEFQQEVTIPVYSHDPKKYRVLKSQARSKAMAKLCRNRRGELAELHKGAVLQGY